MPQSDDDNLSLATSEEAVDALNQYFYGRFPYPWPPMTFAQLEDPLFETVMINQSVGAWEKPAVPSTAKIWVAGCGTNQAIYTALRFPKASVIGSDISSQSLDICAQTARVLGVNNLSLRQENLSTVDYDSHFDYVVCTGVVHHTANPETALGNISRALKREGILELMVYNRFHRIVTSALQKAVRLIAGTHRQINDFDAEMNIAKVIIGNTTTAAGRQFGNSEVNSWPEARLADTLIQPVEHSYTVESLSVLAARCGLELLLPCYNQSNQAEGNVSWNIRLDQPELQQTLDNLPDVIRWQITNLLLVQHSPMLWFFARRQQEPTCDFRERRVCDEFLGRKFVRASTRLRNFVRSNDNSYTLSKVFVPYPGRPDDAVKAVVERSSGEQTMRSVLCDLGIDISDYGVVNEIRIQTTTSLCPYLRSI
jgi:SAM-dependent methyltransferase